MVFNLWIVFYFLWKILHVKFCKNLYSQYYRLLTSLLFRIPEIEIKKFESLVDKVQFVDIRSTVVCLLSISHAIKKFMSTRNKTRKQRLFACKYDWKITNLTCISCNSYLTKEWHTILSFVQMLLDQHFYSHA